MRIVRKRGMRSLLRKPEKVEALVRLGRIM
jgi:hypothetical protein